MPRKSRKRVQQASKRSQKRRARKPSTPRSHKLKIEHDQPLFVYTAEGSKDD